MSFLQDIESPFEVKDYIKMYLGELQLHDDNELHELTTHNIAFLGETKECSEFAKQFLERRSKQRNLQRLKNAHIDDLLSPAAALTPTNDFQEVKVRKSRSNHHW